MTREETAALDLALTIPNADVGIDLATGQPTITVPLNFEIIGSNAIGTAGFRAVYLRTEYDEGIRTGITFRVDRVLTAAEERAMLGAPKTRPQRSPK